MTAYLGVAMVLPSQLWPNEFVDAWCGNPLGTRAQEALDLPARNTSGTRRCGVCGQAMRKLGLAAHYQHQDRWKSMSVNPVRHLVRQYRIGTSRGAGPCRSGARHTSGDAAPRSVESLPLTLPCPICAEPLKRVSNLSRFGRTAQLECPQRHGAYQSFALFLAEKGYFRPFTWADIKEIQASGKRMQCFNCGAGLEPRPHDECPIVDPRSACSIPHGCQRDRYKRRRGELSLVPSLKQTSCPCCGGAVDLTTEMVCSHCMAIVGPGKTEQALRASEAVESQVRKNHESQMPSVSRRKLESSARSERRRDDLPASEGIRRFAIIVIAAITLGVFFFGMTRQKAHEMEVSENKDLDNRAISRQR